MTAVYKWKPKACIPIDAQVAGERLEWLKEHTGGEITPEAVLADARSNNSPLHGAFEWDDDRAAERFRLSQARHMIACLTITVEIRKDEAARPVRAFVSVRRPDAEKSSYVGLATAMSDAELRAQVVDRAWKELLGWREKYNDLSELARVFAAIDDASNERSLL